MKLISNEFEILKTTNSKVILTNKRIFLNKNFNDYSKTISIFLENISSIETSYKSNLTLKIISGIFLLSTIYFGLTNYENNNNPTNLSLILAIVFYLLFWFSRQNVIIISSNGGGILSFLTRGMNPKEIEDFIHKVNETKNYRINELNNIIN